MTAASPLHIRTPERYPLALWGASYSSGGPSRKRARAGRAVRRGERVTFNGYSFDRYPLAEKDRAALLKAVTPLAS